MTRHDIVLHGATGFVGRLIASYLSTHPEGDRFSWAIAGRTKETLERVGASVSERGTAPEVVVVQAADEAAVRDMVDDAGVVLNAAGPYSQYHADHIVGACARSGTHYADLSGESFYQRRMIDEFHAEAERSGARIVLAAGVDSIPSDLSAQLAMERLAAKGARARHVKAVFTRYSGSMSGGTRNSMLLLRSVLASDEFEPGFHTDPYVLAPGTEETDEGETVAGWDSYRFDRDLRRIGGPFFMGPINARVVRRSFALDGHLPCTYAEGISLGAWMKAAWLFLSRGMGYFVGAPIPLRPKSGQGPPPWLQRAGGFNARVHATNEDRSASAVVEVAGVGDPGYLATSKMFAEVGLSLLLDDDASDRAGVLTPATALGATLRRRLERAEDGRFMQFRSL